jgi:hypothetical protein
MDALTIHNRHCGVNPRLVSPPAKRPRDGPDSLCILRLTFRFVMMHPIKPRLTRRSRRCKAHTREASHSSMKVAMCGFPAMAARIGRTMSASKYRRFGLRFAKQAYPSMSISFVAERPDFPGTQTVERKPLISLMPASSILFVATTTNQFADRRRVTIQWLDTSVSEIAVMAVCLRC